MCVLLTFLGMAPQSVNHRVTVGIEWPVRFAVTHDNPLRAPGLLLSRPPLSGPLLSMPLQPGCKAGRAR
jgi:hypothetical protein